MVSGKLSLKDDLSKAETDSLLLKYVFIINFFIIPLIHNKYE